MRLPPQANPAWLAARIPEQRLEQLMRTPARPLVVESIFLLMPRYLNRAKATGLNLAIRWRITAPDATQTADVYDLVIADRRARVVRRGQGPQPLVTITIGATDLLKLATGHTNPMQAYFDGKLKIRGDVMQAARLTALFRIPDPRRSG